jgi:glycerol-3-phosphate dehydrogenase
MLWRILWGLAHWSVSSNRARVTMGRCQGGFCLPRIVRILRDEFRYEPEEYLLRGASSPLFVGKVRKGEDVVLRTPVPAEGVRP